MGFNISGDKMGAKAKIATAKTVSAAKPGPNPGSFDSSPHVGWTSGELQAQIGSKNKDKKKLVMEIWYEFFHDAASTHLWSVKYHIKAQDKDLIGSGWHTVNKLASLSFNFKYKQGSAAPVTQTGSLTLTGQSDTSDVLFSGNAGSTALLPVFQTKHATGDRFGGNNGIQIAW
jgi:hypothetical protein